MNPPPAQRAQMDTDKEKKTLCECHSFLWRAARPEFSVATRLQGMALEQLSILLGGEAILCAPNPGWEPKAKIARGKANIRALTAKGCGRCNQHEHIRKLLFDFEARHRWCISPCRQTAPTPLFKGV